MLTNVYDNRTDAKSWVLSLLQQTLKAKSLVVPESDYEKLEYHIRILTELNINEIIINNFRNADDTCSEKAKVTKPCGAGIRAAQNVAYIITI